MRLAVFVLMAASLASGGCLVVALQPAYDAQSVVFDEALLGRWENAEDGDEATIERGVWKSYKIAYTDRTTTRMFEGNLTKIGALTILDLTEMRGSDPGPLLVPVHGIIGVTIEADTLTVALLDYDRFVRARARKTVGFPPTALDDRRNAVLTGATSDIRQWLMRVPRDAFAAPATFTRQKP